MSFTPVYICFGESLEGVHPSRSHRLSSALVYTSCVESFEGADRSRIRHMRFKAAYKRCG